MRVLDAPRDHRIKSKKPKTRLMNIPKEQVDEDKLAASICRTSYFEFVKEFWPTIIAEKPIWNWHIEFVCNEIQECLERVFRGEPKAYDLVDNQPPSTSKSILFSVMLLPWAWTRMLSFRYIGASYAYPLALFLSRQSRDVIISDQYKRYFPEVQIRKDQNTKGFFANTKGGMRFSVGSNGSVTGMHGHAIGIDDPLNPNEAVSETELDRTNYWIEKTLLSRKVDKRVSVVFMVMQRLHQDDPSGQFLKRKKVRHIQIPADDSYEIIPERLKVHYDRNDGLLDPVRLPRSVLVETMAEMGEVGYAGQYGQSPVPPGGGMFKVKQIRPAQEGNSWKKLVRFWDKAATQGPKTRSGNKAAFTTGVKMGLDHAGGVWILDCIRVQLDSFQRERLIRQTARLDGRHCIVGIEEEPGSGGRESAENTTRRLLGFRVRVVRPHGDKVTRADSFSVQVNAGNVYIPRRFWNGSDWFGWAKDYIQELKFFPFGSFKDQVDASSGAFTVIWKKTKRIGGLRPSKNWKRRLKMLKARER